MECSSWAETTSSDSGRNPMVTLPPSSGVMASRVALDSWILAAPTVATSPLTVNCPRFMAGEPMKPATNSLAGWSYISRGVPTCWSTPSLRTAMRSPMVRASVWSWVT